MKYGHFDLKAKEYVIERPDTPEPWCNYLGSPEYGAIISGNAEGYSFVKSGANGRIMRYRFNSKMALPGRYIYIRDNEDGDYWSATWQPVGKPLSDFKATVRHGTGYSVMTSEYANIVSEVTYYVPLNATYEVWAAKIKNVSDRDRKLSAYGFVEFSNEDNYNQDQVNLQYSLFISRTEFDKNKIVEHISEYLDRDADGSNHLERFLGLAGASANSACGSLDDFIGPYRTFKNPIGVENGKLSGKMNYNGNACGALMSDVSLAPGEERELIFLFGRRNSSEADELIAAYENKGVVDKEIDEIKKYWHDKLNHFTVETPSDEFNNMINVWNAYQCFITFTWSRAASLIYCGERNGYGYRDTVQDIQGIIHTAPEMALEKIRFMLSAQVDNGAGLPLVKFNHNAGHENTPDDPEYVKETGHPSYRADDALWLFPTVYKYVAESGNTDFYDEVIVYANGGEDSVYNHLKKAIDFSMTHLGPHGMPAGLHADWNDCLRLGSQGESTFVAFQLVYAIRMMKGVAGTRGDGEYISYLSDIEDKLKSVLATCWDEDRFIRGIRDTGEKVGLKSDDEASMWLNPQSWSVISGFADDNQANVAMQSVYDILNTPYGAKIMEPPYMYHGFDGALMTVFNLDTKENGGIFSQSQGWLILAEALLGHGDRAFMYFMESSPAAMNDKAEIRGMEPFVHGQFTESTRSPYAGRSHVHWLTGTASTVMVGCVEGICGMRPYDTGLSINPAIPREWDKMSIEKDFRGKHLSIRIDNPNHVESGVKSITVNGSAIEGNRIDEGILTETNDIVVILGA